MDRFAERLHRAMRAPIQLSQALPFPVSLFWEAGQALWALCGPWGVTLVDKEVLKEQVENRLWQDYGMTLELASDTALVTAALGAALALAQEGESRDGAAGGAPPDCPGDNH